MPIPSPRRCTKPKASSATDSAIAQPWPAHRGAVQQCPAPEPGPQHEGELPGQRVEPDRQPPPVFPGSDLHARPQHARGQQRPGPPARRQPQEAGHRQHGQDEHRQHVDVVGQVQQHGRAPQRGDGFRRQQPPGEALHLAGQRQGALGPQDHPAEQQEQRHVLDPQPAARRQVSCAAAPSPSRCAFSVKTDASTKPDRNTNCPELSDSPQTAWMP